MTDDPMLSTHELKQRGWTAALIRDFLGPHDATRPNQMRLGSRRRLPPVKLYREERVNDAESSEEFLVAQSRAMDARDRAERAKLTRQANKAARVEAFVRGWQPLVEPVKVRRGASRKVFEAHEHLLHGALVRASAGIPGLTKRELLELRERLREKYLRALREAYPWLREAE